LYLRLSSFY
jgi:hypothetical protein